VPRAYRSATREEQAAATRQAILLAFSTQLGRPGAGDISLREAAEEAGVSLRTVYHHFPDRESRLVGLAEWADEQFGPLPAIDGVDDLPDHVRRGYRRADRNLELTRAMYVAGLADEVRNRRLRSRRLEIAALLTGIGAPAEPTRRAIAVVSLLASGEAGIPLVDIHGLDVLEAGEAAAQAVEAIVADLRARRREAADRDG
jgi:AcrR family transcriptional regulator